MHQRWSRNLLATATVMSWRGICSIDVKVWSIPTDVSTVLCWPQDTWPLPIYKRNLCSVSMNSEYSYSSDVTLLRGSSVNDVNTVQENGLCQGRCWLWNGVEWHNAVENVTVWPKNLYCNCTLHSRLAKWLLDSAHVCCLRVSQECWQHCSTTYPLKILWNIKTDGTCSNHCDLQHLQLKICHQLDVKTWACRPNNRNEPNVYRILERSQ